MPTRIDMAAALVQHSGTHQRKLEEHLPYLTVVGPGPNPGEVEVGEFPNTTPLQPNEEMDWSLEVRHAIDDLGTALDYCAYEAFSRSSGEGAKGWKEVYFPVSPTSGQFQSYVRERFPKLANTYPAAIGVMESVQPYQSPKNWWLEEHHRLWMEAKHRNLNYLTTEALMLELKGLGPLNPRPVAQAIRFAITERNMVEFFRVSTAAIGDVNTRLRPALGLV